MGKVCNKTNASSWMNGSVYRPFNLKNLKIRTRRTNFVSKKLLWELPPPPPICRPVWILTENKKYGSGLFFGFIPSSAVLLKLCVSSWDRNSVSQSTERFAGLPVGVARSEDGVRTVRFLRMPRGRRAAWAGPPLITRGRYSARWSERERTERRASSLHGGQRRSRLR